MITLTERAVLKLRDLKGTGDKLLRVAVVGGGCSGLSYKLEWVAQAAPNDIVAAVDDQISVVIDPKSALFLKGMELDHSDGLDGVGFQFNNPNAKRSCGCGSSFST